jgi:hypothetical protein
MPLTLTPEQIAAILLATTISIPGVTVVTPVPAKQESESEEEKPDYAPAGTLAESKNVFEGKPDRRGRTTW